jgi:hypothetical protein
MKALKAHTGPLQGPGAQGIEVRFSAAGEHFRTQVRGPGVEGRENRGCTLIRKGLNYALIEEDSHADLLLASDGGAGSAH